MTIDSSQPVAPGPRPDWRLPDIVDIQIRRVDYRPRNLRHFESALARYREAIEFVVRTDGPLPARALGPALFVGSVQLAESEQIGDDAYRFLAFDLERLEPGSPISWGWINTAEEERRETGYRFNL